MAIDPSELLGQKIKSPDESRIPHLSPVGEGPAGTRAEGVVIRDERLLVGGLYRVARQVGQENLSIFWANYLKQPQFADPETIIDAEDDLIRWHEGLPGSDRMSEEALRLLLEETDVKMAEIRAKTSPSEGR